MWIRKHRDIIPAVFVSFYELKSEERPENLSDEELGRHLAELKYSLPQCESHGRKSLADRGVKLCAVLTGSWERILFSSASLTASRGCINSTRLSSTKLFPRHENGTVLPSPTNPQRLSRRILQDVRPSLYLT